MQNIAGDTTGCDVNFLSLRLRNEHQFFSFVGIVHTRGSIKAQEKESLRLFKNSIVSAEDFSYILILTGMGCPRARTYILSLVFKSKFVIFPLIFKTNVLTIVYQKIFSLFICCFDPEMIPK